MNANSNKQTHSRETVVLDGDQADKNECKNEEQTNKQTNSNSLEWRLLL